MEQNMGEYLCIGGLLIVFVLALWAMIRREVDYHGWHDDRF